MDQFKAGLDREQVENKVLEFFKEYDQTKEPQILKMQKRIDNLRKNNSKMQTTHS